MLSTVQRFFLPYLIDIQENIKANIVFQCTFSLEQSMASNLLRQCMGQSIAENRYGAVSELGPRDNKSITGPGIYQLKGDLQAYINTKRSANNTPSQATQAIHRVHSMEPFEFLHFGEEYGERQLSFQAPGISHKLYQACRLTYCDKINPISGNPKKYLHLCLCFGAMN